MTKATLIFGLAFGFLTQGRLAYGHHPHPIAETYDRRLKAVIENITIEQAFDDSTGQILFTIRYDLYPESPFWRNVVIKAWIRLNHKEGLVSLERSDDRTHPHFFAAVSNQNYDCSPALARGASDCLPTSEPMEDLLFWAKRAVPSSPRGKLNAWDVEMAFVNSKGAWDNCHGINFKFHLEE